MRAGIEELFVTFPDYHLELVEAYGEGDRLVARIHTEATMLGPMVIGDQEIPPTGLPFSQDWIAMLRFEGDAIAAIDEFHDNYTILIQPSSEAPRWSSTRAAAGSCTTSRGRSPSSRRRLSSASGGS